jgi:hypothetical protein
MTWPSIVAFFPLRLEDRSALRAAAPLAIHESQFRWLNPISAFRTGRKQGCADLLRGHFRAAGHAPILWFTTYANSTSF